MKRNVMKTKATFTLKSATRGKTVALFGGAFWPLCYVKYKERKMEKAENERNSISGQTESFCLISEPLKV